MLDTAVIIKESRQDKPASCRGVGFRQDSGSPASGRCSPGAGLGGRKNVPGPELSGLFPAKYLGDRGGVGYPASAQRPCLTTSNPALTRSLAGGEECGVAGERSLLT
jgi:hypothetical protein